MRVDLLLDRFDRLVRTPEDAAILETAIFDLAVQGKLVPQSSDDEPASALLEHIKSWKKKLRRSKSLPQLEENEIPYRVPKTWTWARLSEVGLLNPRNQADDDQEASFIPMRLIPTGYGETHSSESRCWGDIRSGYTHFQENDVVVAKITPCFQNRKSVVLRNLVNGLGAGTTELFVFRSNPDCILPEYALIFLKTSKFIVEGQNRMTGTAGQQRVPKDYVLNVPFPLPPFAEQKRIVARVDELLAQTRALAARLQAADEALVPAAQASFQALTDAPSLPARREAWQRIADHFEALTDDPRTLDALKQTILQLAVQGQLVPRESDWKTQPIKHICDVRGGIQKSKDRVPDKNPRRYLTVAHVQRNWIDTSDPRYFEVLDDELEKWRLLPDDILVVEGNGSAEQIGRAAIFHGEIENCVHQNHLIRVRPNGSLLLSEYLNWYLNSPAGREEMLKRGRTTSGLYNLSVGRIKTIEVPLPSLAEQERIVAKVEQFLALCDALAAEVAAREEVRGRLVQAVLNGE